VQPVAGVVDADEVRVAVQVDQEPVDPDHEIHDPAPDQERPRSRGGSRHGQADQAEREVDDVLDDVDAEDAEQLGTLSAEVRQLVVVLGDSGDEPGDADEQEDAAQQHG
jgi:hypothetical protein